MFDAGDSHLYLRAVLDVLLSLRSLSHLLEDLRHARATADSRERQLKEAHALWEAGEASREKAEAEVTDYYGISSRADLRGFGVACFPDG